MHVHRRNTGVQRGPHASSPVSTRYSNRPSPTSSSWWSTTGRPTTPEGSPRAWTTVESRSSKENRGLSSCPQCRHRPSPRTTWSASSTPTISSFQSIWRSSATRSQPTPASTSSTPTPGRSTTAPAVSDGASPPPTSAPAHTADRRSAVPRPPSVQLHDHPGRRRRNAFRDAGAFDESLSSAEDWEMWLRLTAHGHRAAEAPGPLGLRRTHAEQMSGDIIRMADNVVALLERVLRDYPLSSADRALVDARSPKTRPSEGARSSRARIRSAHRCAAYATGSADCASTSGPASSGTARPRPRLARHSPICAGCNGPLTHPAPTPRLPQECRNPPRLGIERLPGDALDAGLASAAREGRARRTAA